MTARTMGSHESADMQTDTWLTPRWILDALGEFDTDPCAAPEPRPWPTAKHMISWPENGMVAPWEGRVWLNPPYSRLAVRWLSKLVTHGWGTALIYARLETRWFADMVWQNATALLFLHERVTFCYPSGKPAEAPATAASVLVAYGKHDAQMLRDSYLRGAFTDSWSFHREPAHT